MYLIGDIGNTDIKIFLFNSKFKIIKKIRFSTTSLSNNYLYKTPCHILLLNLKQHFLDHIQKTRNYYQD